MVDEAIAAGAPPHPSPETVEPYAAAGCVSTPRFPNGRRRRANGSSPAKVVLRPPADMVCPSGSGALLDGPGAAFVGAVAGRRRLLVGPLADLAAARCGRNLLACQFTGIGVVSRRAQRRFSEYNRDLGPRVSIGYEEERHGPVPARMGAGVPARVRGGVPPFRSTEQPAGGAPAERAWRV